MRTPRIVILCAFIFTSFTLILLSTKSSPPRRPLGTSSAEPTNRNVRALFSFNTPLSLFPPNAIISLTDDNTTSFLARPAAFGPLLPSKGLSGQLWIGSGFGDDSLRQSIGSTGAEGELGCSDVPGWVDGSWNSRSNLLARGRLQNGRSHEGMWEDESSTDDADRDEWSASDRAQADNVPPSIGDGTDDYLQPHVSSSKSPESGHSSSDISSSSDHTHADIQSIQESAEITGKVVLLSRGGCGFLEKVKWVQRRGGIALIVGDDTRGGPLIQMYARGDTSNVTIPAIFTSHTTAHLLSSLIPSGKYVEDFIGANGQALAEVQPRKKGKIRAAEAASKEVKSTTKQNGPSSSWFGWLTESDSVKSVSSDQFQQDESSKIKNKMIGDDRDANEVKNMSPEEAVNSLAVDDELEGDEAEEHEGLWVTLTQTSGASPFFDTLLVLVVSPLVTLTIVYALLLIRSRIRRRRWRAPKSVVERLPVRTYQTVASSASSRLPSPTSTSPSTPLLQRSVSIPRPRSRTTSAIPDTGDRSSSSSDTVHPPKISSQGPEHEKVVAVASEWKKYMGKQVECVVCLEEYVDGVSQVMSLPCGHEFHVDCITPWLTTRRRTCPICKGDVVRSLARGSPSSPRYEPYNDDSSDDEEQTPVDQSRNESPAESVTIVRIGDTSGDLEQGILSPTPSRPNRSDRGGSWRSMLASSLRSTAGRSPRSDDEDRDRDR